MPETNETALREEIVRVMRKMSERGLNRGTSGNVSARCGEGMLVTPTGVVPEDLTPQSIVYIGADGQPAPGALRPSSEWQMHLQILARRPDVNGVVHCHSRYATVLACVGKPIPPMHYMVGVSGAAEVKVAPYATYGTVELADSVTAALDGCYACLMANHGQITVAPRLSQALTIADEIEEQAAVYWGTLAIGGPNLLSQAQMEEIFVNFRSYGQRR